MIERHDIERLADMACKLDELKNLLPAPAHQRALVRAITYMHEVAGQIDAEHGFGLYEGAPA